MRLITDIRQAVAEGRLSQPFRAADVRAACPGWASRTYHVFLAKHREGNRRGETVLFVRVASGLYRLV